MKNAFRSLAVTLALGAMLLRALLPQGWMPASAAGGSLVICTVDGLQRISPSHAPLHKGQDERNCVCPFAAAAHLAPPQSGYAILFSSAVAAPDAMIVAKTAPASLPDSSHAPRGPPLSV